MNPYTPGAGFTPPYIAGRDDAIERAHSYLRNVTMRYPQQSVIYYGLRGVGKTVLLNSVELIADGLDIQYQHIEVSESNNFTQLFLAGVNRFLYNISMTESVKDFANRILNFIKSFKITYNIEDQTFGAELQENIPPASGIYTEDFTEILVGLGKAALKSNDTICFFIDEIQNLNEDELRGITTALHRCNQLRLPILVFCAGLPKILKIIGETCSYTERLFRFEFVGALSISAAKEAIENPAKQLGVQYTEDALNEIVSITEGYPYFIQELCNTIWNFKDASTIDLSCVKRSEPYFFTALDDGFFSVRYNRCSHSEKSFMVAMVKCGELPCTTSRVAQIMGKSIQQISPVRARLIAKGLIYAPAHAEIDFTVPQFDRFIQRVNPTLIL